MRAKLTRIRLVFVSFSILAISARAADLPPSMTPGAINPAVTQDNIAATVCVPNWRLYTSHNTRLWYHATDRPAQESGAKAGIY